MTSLLPIVLYSIDPELRWDRKTLEWVVLREFRVHWYRSGKLSSTFIVSAGFRTDLASIPRIARSLIPVIGPNLQAAIVHDWCYTQMLFLHGAEMTKAEADQLFLDGMKSLGVPWLRRNAMYAGVRAGGRGRWKSTS